MADSGVVGEIARPAALEEVDPMVQMAPERTPRRAARARTRLAARCSRADQRSTGAIVSPSTTGCLFRTRAELSPGLEFNSLFSLPRGRMIHTRACVRYRNDGEFGMSFDTPPEPALQAVGAYASQRLATTRV